MPKLLTPEQVMEQIPDISRRTAIKIICEVGKVTIKHKAYCRADALERYIADRTPSSFYNRLVAVTVRAGTKAKDNES